MAQGQPWWMFGTTQAHGVNGEQGIDLGTPYGTPLTSLINGTVSEINYGGWGGDVKIQGANGTGIEFLHPDYIAVKLGQAVSAGQVVAYSGGQLSGGFHPARAPFSSGAHTEFDVMHNGQYVDPTPLISWLQTNQPAGMAASILPGIGAAVPATQPSASATAIGPNTPLASVTGFSLPGLPTGAGVVASVLKLFGFRTAHDFSSRVLLFFIGLLVLGLAVAVIMAAVARAEAPRVAQTARVVAPLAAG